jgi:hypothetical protein
MNACRLEQHHVLDALRDLLCDVLVARSALAQTLLRESLAYLSS